MPHVMYIANFTVVSQIVVDIGPRLSPLHCFTEFCQYDTDSVNCARKFCSDVINDDQMNCLENTHNDIRIDMSKLPWLKGIKINSLKCLSSPSLYSFPAISLEYIRAGDGRTITVDWNSPLMVDGHEVDMNDYPRHVFIV